MKRYAIQPGQTNFRPCEPLLPFRAKGFRGAAILDGSCWWSSEDWDGDADRKDWNKIKGVTSWATTNDRNSAMVAWRPADEQGVFEVCAYTNYPGRQRQTGQAIKIRAGERLDFECKIYARKAQYRFTMQGHVLGIAGHDYRAAWLYREIGTSFGGANNSAGLYGGAATQKMVMWVEFGKI